MGGGGGAGAELARWDLVWMISNSFLSLLPKFFVACVAGAILSLSTPATQVKFFGVNLGLLIRGRIFFLLSVYRVLFFKIIYTSPTPQKLNCPSDL